MELVTSIMYVVLGFVILTIAKIIRDVRTKYDDDAELTSKDNPALGVSVAGYYLSVFIIFIAAAVGEFPDDMTINVLMIGMGIDSAYAIGGIFAMNIGAFVLDKISLPTFSVEKELIEDRNVGMGAVQAASYIASAVIAAGAIVGDTGGWLHALAFWGAGQVALIIFVKFYQIITPYDVHKELERDNVAAGISLAFNMLAISIVLFGANSAAFTGWTESFVMFAILTGVGFGILLFSRVVSDKMMLPKSSLNKEISADANSAAAWIEGAVAVGFASTIVFML